MLVRGASELGRKARGAGPRLGAAQYARAAGVPPLDELLCPPPMPPSQQTQVRLQNLRGLRGHPRSAQTVRRRAYEVEWPVPPVRMASSPRPARRGIHLTRRCLHPSLHVEPGAGSADQACGRRNVPNARKLAGMWVGMNSSRRQTGTCGAQVTDGAVLSGVLTGVYHAYDRIHARR